MKKSLIIHINDGNAEELQNGNFLFVERFQGAEKIIDKYLAEGYEVKQIIPSYTPAIQKEGVFSFYDAGFTVYLEKEA